MAKQALGRNYMPPQEPHEAAGQGSSGAGLTGTLMSYLTNAGGGGNAAGKGGNSPAASSSAH